MKKTILALSIAIFTTLTFSSCFSSNDGQPSSENVTINNDKDAGTSNNTKDEASQRVEKLIKAKDSTEKAFAESQEVTIGEENFQKMVKYIQKKGFVVSERGVACDYQYTFIDKNGNRHAMIAIKRDQAGNPSINGTVSQISVGAYYKSVKDQAHFFGYNITSQRAMTFMTDSDYIKQHMPAVKFGCEEFMSKIAIK